MAIVLLRPGTTEGVSVGDGKGVARTWRTFASEQSHAPTSVSHEANLKASTPNAT
jgi:hypothetical protein